MNMKRSIKAAALAFAAGAAPIASVAASVQLDAVEIPSDTNIVVETGDTLKIEYVYGDNPVTVTKSGGGRLEIATSSISNLSVPPARRESKSRAPAALCSGATSRRRYVGSRSGSWRRRAWTRRECRGRRRACAGLVCAPFCPRRRMACT